METSPYKGSNTTTLARSAVPRWCFVAGTHSSGASAFTTQPAERSKKLSEVLRAGGSRSTESCCLVELLEAGHDVRTTVRALSRERGVRQALHNGTTFD